MRPLPRTRLQRRLLVTLAVVAGLVATTRLSDTFSRDRREDRCRHEAHGQHDSDGFAAALPPPPPAPPPPPPAPPPPAPPPPPPAPLPPAPPSAL